MIGAGATINGATGTINTNTNGRALVGGLGSNPATDFTNFLSVSNNPGVGIDGWSIMRWRYQGGNDALGTLENGGRLGKANATNDGQAFANSSDFLVMSDAYSPASTNAADTFNVSAVVGSDISSGTATFTLNTYLIFDDSVITLFDSRTIQGNPDADDLSLTGLAPGAAYSSVRVLFAVDASNGVRGLIDDVTLEQVPVPEPGSLALLGLGGLLIARRRRG